MFQDPAETWLAYVVSGNGKIVTYVNATVRVPLSPLKNGSYPAFWFGIGEKFKNNL